MKYVQNIETNNTMYLSSQMQSHYLTTPILFSRPSSPQDVEIFHNLVCSTLHSLDRKIWASIYDSLDTCFVSSVNQSDLDTIVLSIVSYYCSDSAESITLSFPDQHIRICVLNKILNESSVFLSSTHAQQLFPILPILFKNNLPLKDIYLLCASLFKKCDIIDPSVLTQSLSSFYQSYINNSLDDQFPRSKFCECLGYLGRSLPESLLPDFLSFSHPIIFDISLLSNWNTAIGCLITLSSLVQRFPPIRPIIFSSPIFSLIPNIKPEALQIFKHFSIFLYSIFQGLKEDSQQYPYEYSHQNSHQDSTQFSEIKNNSEFFNPELLRSFIPCLFKSMKTLKVNVLKMFGMASSYHHSFAEVVFDIIIKNPMEINEESFDIKMAFIYMIYENMTVLCEFSLNIYWERYSGLLIEILDGDDIKSQLRALQIIKIALDHSLPMPDNLDTESFEIIMEGEDEKNKILAKSIIDIISS